MSGSNGKADISIKINSLLNKEGFKQLFAETDRVKNKLDSVINNPKYNNFDPFKNNQNKLRDTANFGKQLKERLTLQGKEVLENYKIDKLRSNVIAQHEKQVEKETKSLGKSLARQAKYQRNSITEVDTMLKKVDKQIASQKPKFQSWALSVMFAGFALQRLATQLITFGTKAYDEVSHSIIGTITANDRLQGSMLYLGYSVGQAMQPILEGLIPIIESISTWVSENEGLVSTMTTLALVIGGTAGVVGALTLAKSGVTSFANEIKGISWTSLGESIKSGIGIISIGYALVESANAYEDFKNGKVNEGIKNAISAGLIGVGGLTFVSNPVAGGMLIAVGVGFKLLDADFVAQMLNVFKVMLDIIAIVGSAIEDILVAPIREVINAIDDVHNMFSKDSDKWSSPLGGQGSVTKASYNMLMDDAAKGYLMAHPETTNNNSNTATTSTNNYNIQQCTINTGSSGLTSSAFTDALRGYSTNG